MLPQAIYLVEAVGTCVILNNSDYDMATAFLAWIVERSADRLAVRPATVVCLIFFSAGTIPSFFGIESATRLVWDGRESFLSQFFYSALSIIFELSLRGLLRNVVRICSSFPLIMILSFYHLQTCPYLSTTSMSHNIFRKCISLMQQASDIHLVRTTVSRVSLRPIP